MISTEMDKSRDVRRGTSRFSRQQINTNKQQQSRTKLLYGCGVGGAANGNGGDLVCLEKAKKEKIRRLSSVNGNRGSHSPCPDSNQHCETEMESCCRCDLSSDNRENQCPHSQHSSPTTNSTTKRFKIPRKFSDDCDAVDHPCVPRKLRSAMKKRGRESFSPPLSDSEKLNHTVVGVESHKKDGVKKPKLNLKQGESDCSRKFIVYGPITKDEEEVVETLYAMAGMFPDSDSMDKNKMNGESVEVKSSTPPKTLDSPVTVTDIEVKKEDTNSICCQQATETVHPSTINESSKDCALVNSLNEPTTGDRIDFPGSQKSHMEAHISISEMRVNTTIPFLDKSEPGAEKSSPVPGNFNVLSDLSLETGFKQPKHVTTLLEKKPELPFGLTSVESPIAEQHMMKEPIKNSLGLWPGLSSITPLGAQSPGSSRRSSTTKIPAWLDAAISGPRPCSQEEGYSTGKVSKVATDRKSMKKCTAHVYISCLIRNLQMQDGREGALQPSLELKPHLGLKRTSILDPNNGSKLRNGIKGAIPISSAVNSASDGNSYEARNAILQQKMLHRDQSHIASSSGMRTPQGIDFLSLSAGGITKEGNNSTNKAGTGIESLPQLQAPYLQSFPQNQSLMPFTIPSTRYTSSTYTDQFSAATVAQQIQLQPQYLSNPFCNPPYTSHSVAAKQQQRLWAAHLAAQYRSDGSSPVLTQFPSWQNGKPETSTVMHCAQTIIPPHSTLDVVGHKYNAVQHQPIVTIPSSSPPARMKRQDHNLPSLYEESNGGFRGGGQPPLQLLCNERL